MLDPSDPWIYEICFPGAISGQTEITCPNCKTLLTVPVNDPIGTETYECCTCKVVFTVNWVE